MSHLKDPNRLIQDIYELKYLLESQVERLDRSMDRMEVINREAHIPARALPVRPRFMRKPLPIA